MVQKRRPIYGAKTAPKFNVQVRPKSTHQWVHSGGFTLVAGPTTKMSGFIFRQFTFHLSSLRGADAQASIIF